MEVVQSGEDTETREETAMPFTLPQATYERLYGYQRTGVAWMAQLWKAGEGGILADEMGLGKTVQICAFLNGLRRAGASHALLLLPATLLDQWRREARTWCPGWPVYVYHGSPSQRKRALRRVSRPMGGLLLTSYTILGNVDSLFNVNVDDPPSPRRRGPGAKRRRLDDSDNEASSEEEVIEPEVPGGGLPELGSARPWDAVICDEAHRMKGVSTLLCKSLRQLHSRCRLLLTGTPVQNALQDLWALMDFAQPGLLGNHATFVKHFSEPIDRGSVRGANPFQVELRRHLSEQLRQLVAPHLLRRTKSDAGLLASEDATSGADVSPAAGTELSGGPSAELVAELSASSLCAADAVAQKLPPKRETVVWLMPTPEQIAVYHKVLEGSDVVREACAKSKLGIEAFRAIGLLKRLCDHPALLLPQDHPGSWDELLGRQGEAAAAAGTAEEPEEAASQDNPEAAAAAAEGPTASQAVQALGGAATGSAAAAAEGAAAAEAEEVRGGQAVEAFLRELPRGAEALLAQSAKLRCLEKMLPALAAQGHRTLVFSQSVKMLDLIQVCCLKPKGLRCLRIDGQTPMGARAAKVEKFQRQRERFQCMLLTTHVGGVGLNLTSADRVILVDPAWNPAVDAQAVDRAFRIGQEKEVRVYRLIMSGLIEDKMFRLQVFKMGLTKTALETESRNYFTSREIHALFEWTEPAQGETRRLLAEKHSPSGREEEAEVARAADEDAAPAWLPAGPALGLSDFGLLYGALAPQGQEEQDSACSVQVLGARQKLHQADEKRQRLLEQKGAAEGRLGAATRGLEEATAKCEEAKAQRGAADEALRRKRADLACAKRAEALAKQCLEAASKGKAAAQEQVSRAERGTAQAEEVVGAGTQAVAVAAAGVPEADATLAAALVDARGQAAVVDASGAAAGNGAVDVPPEHQTALRAALAEIDMALVLLREKDRAWGLAEEAFAAGGEEEPRRKAESAQRTAEAAAQRAVQELAAAGAAFADAMQKTRLRAAKADQVKAAQRSAKAAFRKLNAGWQAASKAREAWAKAFAARRKTLQRSATAAGLKREAEGALQSAERELAAADAEVAARRDERAACERGLEEAERQRAEADAGDAAARQRFGEVKAALAHARQEVKAAVAAEREATGERQALHTACQKMELAHSQLEQAKVSAIRTLQNEEYDAAQVQAAYEQKRGATA